MILEKVDENKSFYFSLINAFTYEEFYPRSEIAILAGGRIAPKPAFLSRI